MKRTAPQILSFLIVLLSCNIAVAVTEVDADDSRIQYFGRWDFTDPLNPQTSWGNSIKVRFEGTGISVMLSHVSATIYFQYSIDGNDYTTFSTTGDETVPLNWSLEDGEHTLHLVRRLEASYGITTFRGLEIDDGADLVEPSPKPELKFEFIGDSITAGFGSEGPHSEATDNVFATYGPRLARIFGGQWNVVARSGIGISVDIQGFEEAMPKRYPDMHFTWGLKPDQWDFSRYVPQIVTIFLGTNDYVFDNPSQVLFESEYIAFVETVRGHYPDAHIYLINPLVGTTPWPMNPDRWAACKEYIQNVVDHFNTLGDSRVHFVETGTQDNPWLEESDYSGDLTHPNESGHSIIADKLVDMMTPVVDSLGVSTDTEADTAADTGLSPDTDSQQSTDPSKDSDTDQTRDTESGGYDHFDTEEVKTDTDPKESADPDILEKGGSSSCCFNDINRGSSSLLNLLSVL